MMGWMAPLRHLGAKVLVGENQSADRQPSMNEISRKTANRKWQRCQYGSVIHCVPLYGCANAPDKSYTNSAC
jgi:hypothetical protein